MYVKITPVFFFGDCLLLQVVVLVDTTNFWSYGDTMYVYIKHNGDESPKKYQGLFLGSKGGRCLGLTTLPPLTLRLLMSYIYMERLFLMFLDHTQRRSTVGRTPLDE